MKFIVRSIGIISIFHAVVSLKYYSCNHPQPDYNDMLCTLPTQVECQNFEVCAEATASLYGKNAVAKGCDAESFCKAFDEPFTFNVNGVNVTANCCKNNLCNGSQSRFQNKAVHYTLMLFSILIQFFYFFYCENLNNF